MSRIDQLLAELCPDGVEYRPLGDMISYSQPTNYIVKANEYDPSASTPVLTAGKTFLLGYTDEAEGVYPASQDSPVILFDDFTTASRWINSPFKVKSSATKLLTSSDESKYDLRYLFHVILVNRYTPMAHSRQWIGSFSKMEVPIPPIPVQEEVVRILDSFTELEAELEAELEKFAYYRDVAFSIDALRKMSGGEVPVRRFDELGSFVRGSGISKKDLVDVGAPCIHYGQIYTRYGRHVSKTLSYVSDDLYARAKKANPGSVIFAITSENMEDVCTPVAWEGDVPVAISGHSCAFDTDLNPRYVAHYVMSRWFQKQKTKFARGAKVIEAKPAELGKALIPVPPRPVQDRVADLMTKYEELTASLTEGLPAEIEARRQQYEHYRDRLLDFPRKEAC